MRKTLKSALSMVLSAAMVITMGSAGSLANDTSAEAAAKPEFTATLNQAGNFNGWDTPAGDNVSVKVTDFGEYSVSTEVTTELDDINGKGAVWIKTDLTDVPADYQVTGKTVKVNDTEYDWSKAVIFKNDDIRLGVVNEWAKETESNPLAGQKVSVKAGDKITFTFEVKDSSAPAAQTTPTPAASAEATLAPVAGTPGTPSATKPEFTATLNQAGNFNGWDTPAGDNVSVKVTDFGEYSVSTEVTTELDDINGKGAVWIKTDLTDVPADYQVIGKTVKVNDTEYDWSKAVIFKNDDIRLSVVNEWASETESNPLAGQKVSVKAGDKITFTFEVKSGSGTTPTATAAPTTVPVTDPSKAPEGTTPSGDGPSFTATFCQAGNFNGWDELAGDNVSVKVNGYGEYTLSASVQNDMDDIHSSGAIWVKTDLPSVPADYQVVGKTMNIDGKEYDWSKAVIFKNDEIRLGVVNAWDTDPESTALSNPFAGQVIPVKYLDKITLTFEVKAGGGAAGTPVAPSDGTGSPEASATPAQSYNAYIGFQTDTWDYRNTWEADAKSTGYDFATQFAKNGGADPAQTVTYQDVKITDNGTYSVSISGADLSAATKFNMLYISTDIPASMTDVKFSDLKVSIDGTEVATLADGIVKKEVQQGSSKYYQIMAINTYGSAGVDAVEEFAYTMPKDSVKIEFTVSGVDFDKSYVTETYGLAKGKTFTSGNFKYKVTKAATMTAGVAAKGEVTVTGLSTAGKKKSSVSVGTSVKKTASYTIKSVAAGAFKGASSLKSVTLSKNIKSIKKNTFVNCTKLEKLTLKAKLSSVAKNSFKGCKKTIKVSGTSAKDNVKKLVKSGYKKFKC